MPLHHCTLQTKGREQAQFLQQPAKLWIIYHFIHVVLTPNLDRRASAANTAGRVSLAVLRYPTSVPQYHWLTSRYDGRNQVLVGA